MMFSVFHVFFMGPVYQIIKQLGDEKVRNNGVHPAC
jgi:hypothetical protein